MKQNSQWLSQVRIWSNRADCTSTPSGSPAALVTVTSRARPPRATSSSTSGSSVSKRYWMTSRGTWPPTVRNSSPGRRPARAAGDPGVTATTRGRDIARSVYGLPPRPWMAAARTAANHLRGRGFVQDRGGVALDRSAAERAVGRRVVLQGETVVPDPPGRVDRPLELALLAGGTVDIGIDLGPDCGMLGAVAGRGRI